MAEDLVDFGKIAEWTWRKGGGKIAFVDIKTKSDYRFGLKLTWKKGLRRGTWWVDPASGLITPQHYFKALLYGGGGAGGVLFDIVLYDKNDAACLWMDRFPWDAPKIGAQGNGHHRCVCNSETGDVEWVINNIY